MRSYRKPPANDVALLEDTFNLRGAFEKILMETKTARPNLEAIHRTLRAIFTHDAVFLLNPSGSRSSSGKLELELLLFPEINAAASLAFSSDASLLDAAIHGDARTVVNTGTHADNFLLIKQLARFTRRKFTFLFIRTVIDNEAVACFGLLSFASHSYTAREIHSFFVLNESLCAYWRGQADRNRKNAPDKAQRDAISLYDLPDSRAVLTAIWKIGRKDVPALFLGETGVGKEIAANTLYHSSLRSDGPFIKFNCANIPESLIDNELFGHERGAFTGAVETVKGRFERADRGMLMLDELGELPPAAQSKLLRVIQEGSFERIGGTGEIRVDVRIVAATSRDLDRMVAEGTFREDLYYRLNLFPIHIPPLRERVNDIPVFIEFFLRRACLKYGIVDMPAPDRDNLAELLAYPWPGNVRQLQNAVERAVINWNGDETEKFAIRPIRTTAARQASPPAANDADGQGAAAARERILDEYVPDAEPLALDEVIARHIQKTLRLTGGKISGPGGAAALLRVNPSTLRAKLKKLGIST